MSNGSASFMQMSGWKCRMAMLVLLFLPKNVLNYISIEYARDLSFC